jgi:flavodoxin/NAD-dependent dihydropyrimidine dehydrogenase PreA subunit
MKILIVYFSGTGSTARFAQEIAIGFREHGHDITLGRSNGIDPTTILAYDLVGFGCPTYSYRAVRMFTDYLKCVPPATKPYFLFCTCGGQPGNTFWDMFIVLKRKGWIMIDKILGTGTDNIRSWRPRLNKPISRDGLLSSALAAARNFCIKIERAYKEIMIQRSHPPPKLKSNLLWLLWGWLMTYPFEMRQIEGNKKVDSALCTRCGLCAYKICPSNSITLNNDRFPIIKNSTCIGCSGCVNLCPQIAIYSKTNRNRHPFTIYAQMILNPPK